MSFLQPPSTFDSKDESTTSFCQPATRLWSIKVENINLATRLTNPNPTARLPLIFPLPLPMKTIGAQQCTLQLQSHKLTWQVRLGCPPTCRGQMIYQLFWPWDESCGLKALGVPWWKKNTRAAGVFFRLTTYDGGHTTTRAVSRHFLGKKHLYLKRVWQTAPHDPCDRSDRSTPPHVVSTRNVPRHVGADPPVKKNKKGKQP